MAEMAAQATLLARGFYRPPAVLGAAALAAASAARLVGRCLLAAVPADQHLLAAAALTALAAAAALAVIPGMVGEVLETIPVPTQA